MTSDAKIGLLLGLVFIFVIAFVINGLPSFHQGDGNKLTVNMANAYDSPPAIDAGLSRDNSLTASLAPAYTAAPSAGGEAPSQTQNQDTNLPGNKSEVKYAVSLPPANDEIAKQSKLVVESQQTSAPAAVEEKPAASANSTPVGSKVYVVQKGDSLASISKKVYGSQKGIQKVNIDRIAEANKKSMKSPNTLYVGQKLAIPALEKEKAGTTKLAGDLFEKVPSMGTKHIDSPTQTAKKNTVGEPAKKGNTYVVRKGDTLWKIAANKLGNGARFGDIAKLNAKVLSNGNNLEVGMQLQMP